MSRRFLPGFILASAIFLSACGGGEDPSTGGVASATDLDEAAVSAEELAAEAVEDATTTGDVTAEEAALAFSQCMRDNGFADFADPEIGANGAPNLRAAIQNSDIDFRSEEFQSAATICRDEAGADNFGAGAGGGGDARAGVQENLLVYTQCLRDEGLDVGDLEFGGGPGAGGGNGGGGAGGGNGGDGAGGGNAGNGDGGNGDGNGGGGAGRAQGNGGAGFDPSTRIAGALGLDLEDAAVTAALEVCAPVLEEAFAGFGGGAGGGGGANAPAANNDA